jgi:hypothetical protein
VAGISTTRQTGVFQQPLLRYAQRFYVGLKTRIFIGRAAILSISDKLPDSGMPLNFLMQGFAVRIQIHNLDAFGPDCAHNRPDLLLLPNRNNASGYDLIHKTSGRETPCLKPLSPIVADSSFSCQKNARGLQEKIWRGINTKYNRKTPAPQQVFVPMQAFSN